MKLLERVGNSALRVIGRILQVMGALWLVVAFAALFDPEPDAYKAVLGGVMFACVFGAPGILIHHAAKKREEEARFIAQVIGLLRTRDRFKPEEIAAKIGRPPLEAEGLIWELNLREGLDLVFHRSTQEYLHRNRIGGAHRLVERCNACAGTFRTELILEGEQLACQYCGTRL